MEKKIYVVVYSSHLGDLYTEVSVHTDYDEASSAFNAHVENIKESAEDEDECQCREYADEHGQKGFNFFDPFDNHEYSVSLEIHELKS